MEYELIQLARFSVDSGLMVLIWLVQIIIYPSFRYLDPQTFASWHAKYTRRIGVIVAPAMILQLGLVLKVAADFPKQENLVQLGLCLSVWLSTYFYSVKCHRSLEQKGKDLKTIDRLISTNWFRTVAWTLIWLIHGDSSVAWI